MSFQWIEKMDTNRNNIAPSIQVRKNRYNKTLQKYFQHILSMPFSLINPVDPPNISVLHYTFPTFVFRNFAEYFVPRKGFMPIQRWNELEQAMYVERLIRRKETTYMILREIKSTAKPNTHTIFEVWDGWQRILAMRAFQQPRVQDTLHLQRTLCSIPAFR
jgi:hypothetical protein